MAAQVVSSDFRSDFICGADLSWLPEVEAGGGVFAGHEGTPAYALDLFRQQGMNYLRLRVWHSPVNGVNGREATLLMARRAHDLGLRLLIDFHYSDWWADPGKQYKPAAWVDLPFPNLVEAVYRHTFETLRALADQGTPPDMVQVGNEITNGMLWEDGRLRGDDPAAWERFLTLVEAGVKAVRDALPGDVRPQIMIHIDSGGDAERSRWFMDQAVPRIQFDIIGLSYYPWWHGPLEALEANFAMLAARYGKPIILVETSYPWTLETRGQHEHPVSEPARLLPAYPPTPAGQLEYLRAVIGLVRAIPNGLGMGFFYWEPAGISGPDWKSPWETLALFDFAGRALPSLQVYAECAGRQSP